MTLNGAMITHIPSDTPMITFDEGFHKWSKDRRISYLHKLASSMNEAARKMQDERNALLDNVATLEKALEFSQDAVDNAKAAMIKNITDTNGERQNLLAEIKQLRAALNEVQNGSND